VIHKVETRLNIIRDRKVWGIFNRVAATATLFFIDIDIPMDQACHCLARLLLFDLAHKIGNIQNHRHVPSPHNCGARDDFYILVKSAEGFQHRLVLAKHRVHHKPHSPIIHLRDHNLLKYPAMLP